ncbi:MAG TPA: hypothetical protein VEC18_08135, partial [Myxococcota bacterium]|nr:hypothetical protein [Myxococcota bacterium]
LLEYGRRLDDVPLVLQYNKRDLSDPYALEELHRKLDVNGAAVFEAVATESTGVLQTLATLAKHVVRSLRGQQFAATAAAPSAGSAASAAPTPTRVASPEPEPASAAAPLARMEQAILAEAAHSESDALDALTASAEMVLDAPWDSLPDERAADRGAQLGAELSIASVGEAERSGERGVRVPIVVRDKAGGLSELVLTIQLDPRLPREGN